MAQLIMDGKQYCVMAYFDKINQYSMENTKVAPLSKKKDKVNKIKAHTNLPY